MNDMMSSMNTKSMRTAQTIQSSAFEELSMSDGDMVDSDDGAAEEEAQFEMGVDGSDDDSDGSDDQRKMN